MGNLMEMIYLAVSRPLVFPKKTTGQESPPTRTFLFPISLGSKFVESLQLLLCGFPMRYLNDLVTARRRRRHSRDEMLHPEINRQNVLVIQVLCLLFSLDREAGIPPAVLLEDDNLPEVFRQISPSGSDGHLRTVPASGRGQSQFPFGFPVDTVGGKLQREEVVSPSETREPFLVRAFSAPTEKGLVRLIEPHETRLDDLLWRPLTFLNFLAKVRNLSLLAPVAYTDLAVFVDSDSLLEPSVVDKSAGVRPVAQDVLLDLRGVELDFLGDFQLRPTRLTGVSFGRQHFEKFRVRET